MEEVSGKVQKTYAGSVGIDLTAGERDCAARDADATSKLPNDEGMSVKSEHPIGAMGCFMV